MKKITVLIFLLCLALITVSAQSGRSRPDTGGPQKKGQREEPVPLPSPPPDNTPSDEEILKISTDLVSIPVSVFDRKGRYVFDLKKEEFEIFEDGKPQEITFFGNTEQPFTVVMMLDISLSTRFKIDEIQRAAIAFVSQLRPQDRMMVVAFAEDVYVLSEFTSDRAQLTRAIRTAKFRQGTSLYDAFDFVVHRHLNPVEGRKAIVLFTDGVDTTSRKAWLEKNLRDADESEALIFPIEYETFADVKKMERDGGATTPQDGPEIQGPLPLPSIILDRDSKDKDKPGKTNDPVVKIPGTSPKDYEVAENYLRELSERSGGRLQRANNLYDLAGAFERIAQELRQQYSLGYYPPDVEKTGVPRKIKVKVTRPNLVVKAREYYSVGEQKQKKP